jgi:spoIIIJ-associated protein
VADQPEELTMETRTFEGRSEEEAVAAAAESLGRPIAAGGYRLVGNRKGFWGVQRKVVIEVDVPGEPADPAPAAAAPAVSAALAPPPPGAAPAAVAAGREEAFATEVTREIVDGIGLDLLVTARKDGTEVRVSIEGRDSSRLTAQSGELLSAIDYLVGKIALRELGPETRIAVDAAGFRDRREEELGEMARRAAEQARKTGRKQLLPPLAPAERRIVHLALANQPGIRSESEGEGFRKRVGVFPGEPQS